MPAGFADYLELTKPRLSSLVLATTAAGWWMACRGTEPALRMAAALFATALLAGGANALNEWAERDYDALMQRTKQRPIPSGKISPPAARRFGWLLIGLGLAVMVICVNTFSAALGFLSVVSYLYFYTPLKRHTALCTLAGAIPGALPPMIGWAAARNRLDPGAWALFWLLFVWQLPHFLALAQLYRQDYAKAGYKMLSVVEPTGAAVARQAVLYGLVLVPVSLFPSMIGLAGQGYFYSALLLSAGFLAAILWAAKTKSAVSVRGLFRSSIAYLPLLLLVLAFDKGPMGMVAQAIERRQAVSFADYGAVHPFVLMDASGSAVSTQSLLGKVWVAGFIFTRCAGQCPMIMGRMLEIEKATDAVQMVAISVDPAYDTPQVLSDYAKHYPLDGRRWQLLTDWPSGATPEPYCLPGQGCLTSTRRLSAESFHLSAADGGPPQEPVTHSVRLALVDQRGRIRGYYNASEPEAMAHLKRDAGQLAAKGG